MNPIIQIEHLNFEYKKTKTIFQDESFIVNTGEILGIGGQSGSGKTTLCYILKGIIPHTIRGNLSGTIIVNNHSVPATSLAKLARSVGMVFQDINTQLFADTVREEIQFGLKNLKMSLDLAENALEELNLKDLAEESPLNLSMGQKQRVILASILAMQPKILILDEPSVHLDFLNRIYLKNWLFKLNVERKMTILIASNDPWLIGNLCEEIIYINHGSVTRRQKTELMELSSSWIWRKFP